MMNSREEGERELIERPYVSYLLIHEIEVLRTWIQRSDSRLFPSSPVVIRTHTCTRTRADERVPGGEREQNFAMC